MISSIFRLAVRAALAAASLLALAGAPLAAQESTPTGRIGGRILDATTGQGISDVGIQVVGTTLGAMSGFDGRYTIMNIPAGTVTIQARRIGYQPKTVTGILLDADGALALDITLDASNVQLEAVTVSAAAERGSVSEALDQQRTANGVVNSVTAEQIAKSPDGDAAQAVQRVSGVTVQDGKYVFVRGLGERYTTTSLNGARIPSPEPERKVVPLDLFPSSLLQSITTTKTFTPDLPGDFSGAQVDIKTREFPLSRQVVYSTSLGINAAALGDDVLAAPTTGLDWLAFGEFDRDLPFVVDYVSTLANPPRSRINQAVGAFRNAWSPDSRSGSPNYSTGISIGGTDPLFGQRIGYLASATYSVAQEVRTDEVRAYAEPIGAGEVREMDRFDGSTGRSSVLWGGMANLSTLVGTSSRISLNNTYSRSADNEARREFGSIDLKGGDFRIDRLRYVERSIRSSQLAGEHEISSRHRLDWRATSSGVTRDEPDRSDIVYSIPFDGDRTPVWFAGDPEGAIRLFGELDETSWEGGVDYRLTLGSPEQSRILKLGALGRTTDRTADNRSFSITSNSLTAEERAMTPERIFDGRYTESGESVFTLTPYNAGGSYAAEDRLAAGYAMAELSLTDRIQVVGGARLEHSSVVVDAVSTIGEDVRSDRTYTDVLPSLAVNLRLTPLQNLRVSASQTLSRPEYRELAGIQFRDVIGGEIVQGNPLLERTLIQNADVRYEWYPSPGEILSIGVFAKRFDAPIERVYLSQSGSRVVRYVNADEAINYGLELEARKDFGSFADGLAPFDGFVNATLMRSDVRIRGISVGGVEVPVNADRAMVGQAPYVVNAGLTWTSSGGGASATALYNVVGERVVNAAEAGLPDVVERPRHALDLALRLPLFETISAKLDAKNLLDAPYEVYQGSVLREHYRSGRVFALGLTWRP